jgi:hypothetical protein
MMPAINFAGSRKGKASVLLFLCAGLNHSQKPKKRIYRRGAETQSSILLTAPAAQLTILIFSLRLCGKSFLFF